MRDLSKQTELSKLLFDIGYYFYKCRGIEFEFEVKNNIVYAINLDNKKKMIFTLKDNKIFKINSYIKSMFKLPTTEIKVDGWEKYIIEG